MKRIKLPGKGILISIAEKLFEKDPIYQKQMEWLNQANAENIKLLRELAESQAACERLHNEVARRQAPAITKLRNEERKALHAKLEDVRRLDRFMASFNQFEMIPSKKGAWVSWSDLSAIIEVPK